MQDMDLHNERLDLGERNTNFGAEQFGFEGLGKVYWNYRAPTLYEHALAIGEVQIADGGALLVTTGEHTGRSAKDKCVVRDATTQDAVWWDNNAAIEKDKFDVLMADMLTHAKGKDLYAQDLYGGADPARRIKARVFTQFAWHSLFIRNLLIRPDAEDLVEVAGEDVPGLDVALGQLAHDELSPRDRVAGVDVLVRREDADERAASRFVLEAAHVEAKEGHADHGDQDRCEKGRTVHGVRLGGRGPASPARDDSTEAPRLME